MASGPGKEQDNTNIQEFNKFLVNNEELLQQKYKEYFIKDSLKITDKNPSPHTVVKFISDVFSFDKNNSTTQQSSQEKAMTEKIEASLKESYKQFLKQNSNIKQFNSKVALELLKFCIVNNQLFAVQYQMSSQQDKQGENPQKNQKGKGQASNDNDNFNKDDGSEAMNNRSLMSNQFDEHGKMNGGGSSFDMQNQFNFHEELKPQFDPLIIKKNTKIIFEYYCKQQMSLSPNLSFDRIEREASHLNMSKFIMMARLMNMFNSVITKDLLIKKFRKISQGKREIDFKQFDILLSQLQVDDPTLVARSQLSNPNIHLFLKTNKKPFDTQDMMPRQLVKNRVFTKKLTVHSGKMEEDLKADLKAKKDFLLEDNPAQSKLRYLQDIVSQTRIRNSSLQRAKSKQMVDYSRMDEYNNKYGGGMAKKQQDIVTTKKLLENGKNPSRLYSQDMHLISKIIPASNDDDKWLGQYKIQMPLRRGVRSSLKQEDRSDNRRSFQEKQSRNALLIRDLKNRIKQIQKTEHDTSSLQETRPYLGSPRRY